MKDLDVVFAFDLSGSMGDMIDGAKQDALTLMESIGIRIGSQHFGVIGFSDYIDIPYHLYQPLTGDYEIVQSAIQSLSLVDGGDAPEAYGRAVYEAYSDPMVGWRNKSDRYLIIFGDSIPHDPDAGRDEILGTADDLVWSTVLDGLSLHEINFIYVSDPSVSNDSDLLQEWREWAFSTGGGIINCYTP